MKVLIFILFLNLTVTVNSILHKKSLEESHKPSTERKLKKELNQKKVDSKKLN